MRIWKSTPADGLETFSPDRARDERRPILSQGLPLSYLQVISLTIIFLCSVQDRSDRSFVHSVLDFTDPPSSPRSFFGVYAFIGDMKSRFCGEMIWGGSNFFTTFSGVESRVPTWTHHRAPGSKLAPESLMT